MSLYTPLGIQALKPFLVCSELRPDQRHRNPHRPQSLVGRSVSPRAAECSLLPALAWSGKALHEYSPNPRKGPREDAAGLKRRQGFLVAPPEPHGASALHLLGFQPAEPLAPPIIRHLTHPDLADCIHHVLALRDQNIDLPQLRDGLVRLVSLPCHCSPPGCQRHTSSRTTSMGVDHYVWSKRTLSLLRPQFLQGR